MGITGLLTFIEKAILKDQTLEKFRGEKVAVDTYCILHKIAVHYAKQLVNGQIPQGFLDKLKVYVDLFKKFEISAVFVMDGRNLQSKESTEAERKRQRETSLELAKAYEAAGKIEDANEAYKKAIDINFDIHQACVKLLRELKQDVIVSMHEGDAQIACLHQLGLVTGAITDDSDLIVYGLDKIAFKLKLDGSCDFYESGKLPLALNVKRANFRFHRFRWMCILSGCDYAANIPGVGLQTAFDVAFGSTWTDYMLMFEQMYMLAKKIGTPSDEYIKTFEEAEWTFLYQLVYDPREQKCRSLNPYPPGKRATDFPFAGTMVEPKMAFAMALGNVNFNTMTVIGDFDPMNSGYDRSSIWWRELRRSTRQNTKRLAEASESDQEAKRVCGNCEGTLPVAIPILNEAQVEKSKPEQPEPEPRSTSNTNQLQLMNIKPTGEKKKRVKSTRALQVGLSRTVNKPGTGNKPGLLEIVNKTNERYRKRSK